MTYTHLTRTGHTLVSKDTSVLVSGLSGGFVLAFGADSWTHTFVARLRPDQIVSSFREESYLQESLLGVVQDSASYFGASPRLLLVGGGDIFETVSYDVRQARDVLLGGLVADLCLSRKISGQVIDETTLGGRVDSLALFPGHQEYHLGNARDLEEVLRSPSRYRVAAK